MSPLALGHRPPQRLSLTPARYRTRETPECSTDPFVRSRFRRSLHGTPIGGRGRGSGRKSVSPHSPAGPDTIALAFGNTWRPDVDWHGLQQPGLAPPAQRTTWLHGDIGMRASSPHNPVDLPTKIPMRAHRLIAGALGTALCLASMPTFSAVTLAQWGASARIDSADCTGSLLGGCNILELSLVEGDSVGGSQSHLGNDWFCAGR